MQLLTGFGFDFGEKGIQCSKKLSNDYYNRTNKKPDLHLPITIYKSRRKLSAHSDEQIISFPNGLAFLTSPSIFFSRQVTVTII